MSRGSPNFLAKPLCQRIMRKILRICEAHEYFEEGHMSNLRKRMSNSETEEFPMSSSHLRVLSTLLFPHLTLLSLFTAKSLQTTLYSKLTH